MNYVSRHVHGTLHAVHGTDVAPERQDYLVGAPQCRDSSRCIVINDGRSEILEDATDRYQDSALLNYGRLVEVDGFSVYRHLNVILRTGSADARQDTQN